MKHRWTLTCLLFCTVLMPGWVFASGPATTIAQPQNLALTVQESEPVDGRKPLALKEFERRRQLAHDKPRDRTAQFLWVRALIRAGRLGEAVEAVEAWRKKDAYNLVVVRMLGDLYAELGQAQKARRVYSAVVELLPNDVRAHRALATVLKQNGDLAGAYQRLTRAAELQPADTRIAFELADVAHRMDRLDEARTRFAAIVALAETPRKIRYPAKQRLAQILGSLRADAKKQKDVDSVRTLTEEIDALAIRGGLRNDIKVYLTWDTDRTDVDLWVTNPGGQTVSYKQKKGRFGGKLFDDVTDGYGPESFTAKSAAAGTYLIQVNYFGTRRSTFTEARGEVIVVLNEGRPSEKRHVLPYRLFHPKQTVTVAYVRTR